jgi:hypothetical protein
MCVAALLADNNRLTELQAVLESFNDIAAEQRGEVKAVVTTAEVGAPALLGRGSTVYAGLGFHPWGFAWLWLGAKLCLSLHLLDVLKVARARLAYLLGPTSVALIG